MPIRICKRCKRKDMMRREPKSEYCHYCQKCISNNKRRLSRKR